MTGRCMAVVGSVHTGPLYCGHRAKDEAYGRPVCGVHRAGQPGIEWFGDRGRYPHGTAGNWQFYRGTKR